MQAVCSWCDCLPERVCQEHMRATRERQLHLTDSTEVYCNVPGSRACLVALAFHLSILGNLRVCAVDFPFYGLREITRAALENTLSDVKLSRFPPRPESRTSRARWLSHDRLCPRAVRALPRARARWRV